MKKFLGVHALFSIQILLNSIAGYLFMRLLAAKLGVSSEKDAFDIAYSVPFVIMNLGGFSFLHGVVTTQFVRIRKTRPEKVNEIFSAFLAVMLASSLLMMGVCTIFSGPIIRILGPGLPPDLIAHTSMLMVVMLPLVLFLGISTFLSAVLVAYEVALSAEFVSIITRMGVVTLALLPGQTLSVFKIAWLLVLWSVFGLLLEVGIVLRRTPVRLTRGFTLNDPAVVAIGGQAAGLLTAALAAQASMSYMRRLATLDGPGTLAAMTYAMSIAIPLSQIVGKPLSMVFGPRYIESKISDLGSGGSARRLFTMISGVLIGGSVLACMISIGAPKIISLMYSGGRFGPSAIASTLNFVVPLLWSLPPALVLWIALFPLLSHRNSHAATLVYNLGYISHCILSAVFYRVWGGIGLAWAYTICVLIQATAGCMILLREAQVRRFGRVGDECPGY